MGSIIFDIIGLASWIVITIRLYLNLASIDVLLAICGVISGLFVIGCCVKQLGVSIEKWRRDDR